jgi:hypothetical protein
MCDVIRATLRLDRVTLRLARRLRKGSARDCEQNNSSHRHAVSRGQAEHDGQSGQLRKIFKKREF